MPPKGFATAMIDMFGAEDIGLNKFDILSQRGLGHINPPAYFAIGQEMQKRKDA